MSSIRHHLLICSRSHEPHGGADRIIADLCRELPSRGWEVTLGLTQGAQFNDVERYRDVYPDLPIVSIDGRLGTRRARLASLRHTVERTQPDVVLSMRVFDVYEAVGRLKTTHGPRLAVGIRAYEQPYLEDLVRYRDVTDLCVTSGELIATACRDACSLEAERIVSIGGGVHPPAVAVQPRNVRHPIRLMYAGRLASQQKRILDLPPFLNELDRRGIAYELDIAGIGPCEPELRARLRDRIDRGIVRLHGWLSREDLYERLYPQADCFVHFAAWEGITIAPREAMAHGVVPVISRFPGLEAEGQFVEGRTALTFPVGDVAAVATCVDRLLNEAGLLNTLSQSAMRSQQGRYSFRGSIDAWSEAFERCLQLPCKRGPLPRIPERIEGRLTRAGVPASWQARLRGVLHRPVQHASPGSEWPTNSGLTQAEDLQRFAQVARETDHQIGVEG